MGPSCVLSCSTVCSGRSIGLVISRFLVQSLAVPLSRSDPRHIHREAERKEPIFFCVHLF